MYSITRDQVLDQVPKINYKTYGNCGFGEAKPPQDLLFSLVLAASLLEQGKRKDFGGQPETTRILQTSCQKCDCISLIK